MSRVFLLGVALIAALALASDIRAHEGHVHKVMGTLIVRDVNRLEVRTTNGKTLTITLNEKTKVLRGKVKIKIEQITAGERGVVTAVETKGKDGKLALVATEIRLAAISATGSKQGADDTGSSKGV